MNMLTLKNGSEEVETLVRVTMISVEQLLKQNPIAFYELVEICRDPQHELFGVTGDVLKGLALMEPSGRVHDSIRNIVLSAVEGSNLGMTLTSPIKPVPEQS